MISFSHAQEIPKFENYKTKNIYTGPIHNLVLDENEKNFIYGEYLHAAKNVNKINFAGHYIFFTYGCGGGAICGSILNSINGRLVGAGTDAYDMNFWFGAETKIDSSLLIISGKVLDEKDPSVKYLNLENDNLKLIKTNQLK